MKSEDKKKIKFLSKSLTVEALACIQFYLDQMMYHWQEQSLSVFCLLFPLLISMNQLYNQRSKWQTNQNQTKIPKYISKIK